jgi:hypothetical protein
MKRTIPQIRDRLRELAIELDCPELRDLAEETRRDFCGHKAAPEAAKITPERAAEILHFVKRFPHLSNRAVGRIFHVDGGRVSELKNGKRVINA